MKYEKIPILPFIIHPSSFILSVLLAGAQVMATNTAIYTDAGGKYFYAQWTGIEPGRSYQLQFSPDARNWGVLANVTNSCCTNCPWVQQTPIHSPKCFFRIQQITP